MTLAERLMEDPLDEALEPLAALAGQLLLAPDAAATPATAAGPADALSRVEAAVALVALAAVGVQTLVSTKTVRWLGSADCQQLVAQLDRLVAHFPETAAMLPALFAQLATGEAHAPVEAETLLWTKFAEARRRGLRCAMDVSGTRRPPLAVVADKLAPSQVLHDNVSYASLFVAARQREMFRSITSARCF